MTSQRLQILMIVPMALFELAFLAVCLFAGLVHPKTGKQLVSWSLRTLPGQNWYMTVPARHRRKRMTPAPAVQKLQAASRAMVVAAAAMEQSVPMCRVPADGELISAHATEMRGAAGMIDAWCLHMLGLEWKTGADDAR